MRKPESKQIFAGAIAILLVIVLLSSFILQFIRL